MYAIIAISKYILRMLSLKKLVVNTSQSYNVIIKRDIINILSSHINSICTPKNISIITDSNVAKLYLDPVLYHLKNAGFKVNSIIIPAGESSKSISTLEKIYLELSQGHISKSDLIISLGGGMVSDITGFAASTFLRGIHCMHIPTSLIAQVDASIGGKTAINLSSGKNLVGAFYQPISVLIDPNFLTTLPKKEISCGMAEVIKYSLIRNKALFDKLSNYSGNILEENFIDDIIFQCIKIKKDIVEHDERDKNERMILNFGHTIGHAIEKYFNYSRYSHGHAIALGMLEIIKLGEKLKLTEKSCYPKTLNILRKYNLPTSLDISLNELFDFIVLDKKNINNKLNLVFIKDVGKSFIKAFSKDEIKNIFMEVK